MDNSMLDEEWGLLSEFLPPGWRALARTTGALRRSRGIPNADALLRVILLHAAGGLSLRQAVARARIAGLASLSDVALLKRLRSSEPWLRAITQQMLARSPFAPSGTAALPSRRIRVVDATDVEEPGATGTSWRVHYTLVLPTLECDFFELTDVRGGETYKRVPVHSGDVILGDRGYSHREGVAHVVRHGGDVVVRLNSASFPLVDERGAALSVLPLLRSLRGHEPGEWPVWFEASRHSFSARLCAIRKSQAAAESARKRALRRGVRKQTAVSDTTLELAEYVCVLTTLSSAELPTAGVLELYRMRWQVELAFKRMKSLLSAGHVPKYNAQSARAWVQAKLLTVLLIERLVSEAKLFSPWGFRVARTQPQSMA